MLTDGGNDRNVVFSVGRVQQGVETASPWRYLYTRPSLEWGIVQVNIVYVVGIVTVLYTYLF